MHYGAVAMLDVLGFKGIWEREEPRAVLDRLRAMERGIGDMPQRLTPHLAKLRTRQGKALQPDIRALFLSDTIVCTLSVRDAELDERARVVVSLTLTALTVHAAALVVAGGAHPRTIPGGHAPMNYRGAVTWGQFEVDRNFLVGPAIDQVADLERQLDAAVVVITPEASTILRNAPPDFPLGPFAPGRLTMDFDAPFKTGALPSLVVNPLAVCSTPDEQHDVMEGMKRAFGPDPMERYPVKYRNTLDILSAARRALQ